MTAAVTAVCTTAGASDTSGASDASGASDISGASRSTSASVSALALAASGSRGSAPSFRAAGVGAPKTDGD